MRKELMIINMYDNKERVGRKPAGVGDLKKRHKQKLMKRKIRIAVMRVISAVFIAFLTLLIVFYLNPLFNIQEVDFDGNKHVSEEYLKPGLENIAAENVFRVTKKRVLKEFSGINYINDVYIKRGYFPPRVKITFVEAQPYGSAKIGDKYIMFDEKCRTLQESSAFIEGAPKIYGTDDIKPEDFHDGSKNNKVEALLECMKNLEKTGMLDKVSEVSVESISNIKLSYDGRFSVIIGSAYDVESKLLLFLTTISNAEIPEDARGTIDLSTGGVARYTPE